MAVETLYEQFSTKFTQGRLHCSQHIVTYTAKQVLSCTISSFVVKKHHAALKERLYNDIIPSSLPTNTGLHGKRVNAYMPLQIAPSP